MLWESEGQKINPDKNLSLCLVSKSLRKLIVLVHVRDVNAIVGGVERTFLNVTDDYFLVTLCMIGFFHTEWNHVCLSLLSRSLFLNRDSRIVGVGRVERETRMGSRGW